METVLPSPTAFGHISVCMASICLGILATTLAQEAESNHMQENMAATCFPGNVREAASPLLILEAQLAGSYAHPCLCLAKICVYVLTEVISLLKCTMQWHWVYL